MGVASVLIGFMFMWGGANTASADTNDASETAITAQNQGDDQKPADSQNDDQQINNDAAQSNDGIANNGGTGRVEAKTTTNESQDQSTPVPSYYNITVNYRDVTRYNQPIQTLTNNKWQYQQPFKQTAVRAGDKLYQIFKAPYAGYKLMNPEVLDQYFTFDTSGYATLKSGLTDQDINITLDYAMLSPIKVEYVDVDNGNVLASMVLPTYWITTESPAHQAGDVKAPDASRYEGAAINIPGYELVSEPVLGGKITGQTQNSLQDPNYVYLTFKYKKVMTNDDAVTTTPGKGSDGAVIVNQWTSLPGMFTIQGVYGTRIDGDGNGDVEKKTSDLINHYAKQGFSYVWTTGKYYNSDYYNYYAKRTSLYLLPNKPVVVRYVDEQGNQLATDETIAFNRANPDQTNEGLNEKEHWYPAGEWQAEAKSIDGYHLVKTAGATSGQFTAYQYVTTFIYAKDQGNVIVKVHDLTDNKDLDNYKYETGLQDVDTPVNYQVAKTIAELQKAGYKVTNPDVYVPGSITKGTQTVTIYVEHDTVTVTPDKPGDPDTPVNPDNPTGPKFPEGTYNEHLNHSYVRTINYVDDITSQPVADSKEQKVNAKRTALVDKVNGNLLGYVDENGQLIDGDGWQTDHDGWEAVQSPEVDGYLTPDITEVEAVKINPNDPSNRQVVTVSYKTKPGNIDPENDEPGTPVGPTPTTPETPNTPAPEQPMTPETPNTPAPEKPTTSTTIVRTSVGDPKKDNSGQTDDIASQLPQTGYDDQKLVAYVGLGMLTSLLALVGLKKRQQD